MNRYRLLALSVVLVCLVTTNAFALDVNEPLRWGFGTDYFTKYVWRGQNLNDESVLQPWIYLSKYGFTATVWGNMNLTDKVDNRHEFSELDYTLEYSNDLPGLDGVQYYLGTIYYDYPNTTTKPTTEIYGGLGLSEFPLAPRILVYRDIDEIDGSYVQAEIGHTFEKLRKWTDACYCDLELGASLGYGSSQYNTSNFEVGGGRFNDLTLTAALPFCLNECLTIKPSLNYSTMLSNAIRTATEHSDNFWLGLSVAIEF